jgi:hypothetical protein
LHLTSGRSPTFATLARFSTQHGGDFAAEKNRRRGMTLTRAHIELLRQLNAKPQVSSVRFPLLCHDLELAGYAKITPTKTSQDLRVAITPAGQEALLRVARQTQGA